MPTRPDVALIAPYPPAGERHGGHSGVASYAANLARALAASGAEVHVIAPHLDGDPPAFDDGDVRVRRCFPLGARALPAAFAQAGRVGADVIHLQFELFLYGGPRSLAGLLPAMAGARRSRVATPLVTTLHQVLDPATIDRRSAQLHRIGVPPVVARRGLATVQRSIAAASAATIVHEEPFRRILPDANVIPHGVEQVDDDLERAAARARLGVDDRFVVLCFGFLAPYKGVELVLEARRHAGPDVEVVVAGGDHPRLAGRDDYATALRARYGGRARFTGWVPDSDVGAWFRAADIAVFPYPRPFSASGVLALALAHGTPVLLSPALARCAGAPSALTMPMEPRTLGLRLDELAAKPEAVDALRAWTGVVADGRQWPDVARRHHEIYEEVLRGERPSGRRIRTGQPR